MKKLSRILALAAFLASVLPAIPSMAQDVSGCSDCAVGDPLGGRAPRKRHTVKKSTTSATAPSTGSTTTTPPAENAGGATK